MKGFKKVVLLVAVLSTLVPGGIVMAQASQDYLNLVKTYCEPAKHLIDKQRRSDLVARINKGRAYQTLIDQQSAFALRLRNNKISADTFSGQTTVIQDKVNQFRLAYNNYDDSMERLLTLDCHSKPQEFTDQLISARSLRATIGNEVKSIDIELAKYRQSAVDFRQEIDRLNNPAAGEQQ